MVRFALILLNMVIFNSYVKLPEGTCQRLFLVTQRKHMRPKGPQFNGARRKPRQLSGCSSHSAIKINQVDIWNSQHPPTCNVPTWSYMFVSQNDANKMTWFAQIRSEMLTTPTMSSPSPRPVKQIAGWKPCDSWGFTTFWGVHLGEWQFHDIHNDIYVCVGSA